MSTNPFAGVGLMADMVKFIDFVSTTIKESKEISQSPQGATQANEDIETICTSLRDLSLNLVGAPSSQQAIVSAVLSPSDVRIKDMAQGCVDIANKILDTVHPLARGKSSRKAFSTLYYALKCAWKRGEVKALEDRLEKLREQLNLEIVALASDRQCELQQTLQTLKEQSLDMEMKNESRLDTIQQTLKDIRLKLTAVSITSFTGEALSTPVDVRVLTKQLSDIASTGKTISSEQAVLASLYFPDIAARLDSIPKAHTKTFNWVFQSSNRAKRDRIRVGFVEWLRSGRGVYWVSGKPGSGKSTLMKFLSFHKHTASSLAKWATTQECLTASCFFWSAGTPLQKSQLGLFRTLLFEILKQCPNLMPSIVPQRWMNSQGGNTSELSPATWTLAELRQAIQELSKCKDISKKFCLFIDGLDEYEGNHDELIQIIKVLSSTDSIKLCVSSRPWNVFEDAYGKSVDKKLYMQDLTRNDIKIYVQSKLQEHPNWRDLSVHDTRYKSLVEDITNKAQGVFLWIFLVMRSLYEGLTNGDTLFTLEERIRRLPADLEQYFKHMLTSVDSLYYVEMARYFHVALHASRPLTLMLYSFLEENEMEKSCNAIKSATTGMDNFDIATRRGQMQRRINSRCKGLLEVYQDPSGVDYLGYKVDFLHRTVRDFLRTREMADFLAEHAPKIETQHSIFTAYVALIHNIPRKESYWQEGGPLSTMLKEAFHYAYKAELVSGKPLTYMLDDLEYSLQQMSNNCGFRIPWFKGCYDSSSPGGQPPCASFLEFAVHSGLKLYVEQKLRVTATNSRNLASTTNLLSSILVSYQDGANDAPDMSGVVSILLDQCDVQSIEKSWKKFASTTVSRFTQKTKSLDDYSSALRRCRLMEVLLKHGASTRILPQYGPSDGVWADLTFATLKNETPAPLVDIYLRTIQAFFNAGADPNRRCLRQTVWRYVHDIALRQPNEHFGGGFDSSVDCRARVMTMFLGAGATVLSVADLKTKVRDAFPPRLAGPVCDAVDKAWESQSQTTTQVAEKPPLPEQGYVAWIWQKLTWSS